ncbi:MAG: DEAD/DEAH box helicase family protein [Ruminococcus sp.]|nr:DEAD/DEAH box helicase family protein [Ruminococcus sp.]
MIQFRDYQKDYIREVSAAFEQGQKRLCVTAPCGSGKTALFAGMAQAAQNNGKVVWFLVHRRELLDQTEATFDRFGIERKSIYIGMVGTYANHLDSKPAPDLIVFDECHFSMANTWQKILNRFPDAYLIGLTATPCRLDGRPLGSIYEKLIDCVSIKELICRGYLSGYRYFAPAVADLSELKRKGSDFDNVQAAEILSERAVFGDVTEHYRHYADGLQAICYCSSVMHSEATAKAFRDAGISAVHFDANTPAGERRRIIEDYRERRIQILCNVDLISVGFDCPDCECCILLRPTMSTALFIQQSMRCMRPKPDKTAVILDHVNNYVRHGLPDQAREWTLEGKLKAFEPTAKDGMFKIRMCPNCFCTYEALRDSCPYCKTKYVPTVREIKNRREIRLREIKEERREKAQQTVKEYDTADRCRSLAELHAFAKKKGYKPQWAYIQAKQRGWLR